jgi:ABC-type sugar transport system permease subunit
MRTSLASAYGRRAVAQGWLYLIPAVLFFALFIAYPLVANLIGSLQGHRGGFALQNYQNLFRDPIFWTALKNSLIWVVLTLAIQMVLGFVLALLIEAYLVKGRALFRTLLFLPMVITPSVIAIVFTTLYAPDYGLLYGIFARLGLANAFPALLGTPNTATLALILVNAWQWTGFFVLLYSVGIAQVDRELLDAAEIDGIRGFGRIRYLFLPLVRPTHITLLVLGTLQALQQFPLIYLMTQGGPANSSQVLATYIFQVGFVENDMRYASAISIVLFAVAVILVAAEYLLTRERPSRA